MALFLWIFLLIEVIISSILLLILLFIIIKRKDIFFSRKGVEHLQEIKGSFKPLSYLFLLNLISFFSHEIIELLSVFFLFIAALYIIKNLSVEYFSVKGYQGVGGNA